MINFFIKAATYPIMVGLNFKTYGVQISGKLQVYIFIHSSQVFIIPG